MTEELPNPSTDSVAEATDLPTQDIEDTTAPVEEQPSASVATEPEAVIEPPTPADAPPSVPTVEPVAAARSTPADDELAQLRETAARNWEGWQRALADFDNYRRRTERQRLELRDQLVAETLAKVFPISDDFDLALANIPAELQENPWMNGVRLITNKFKKLFEDHNITEIDATGQPFDPNSHQAISMEDSETVASGHVIQTLQKGYKLGDKVLRPALVRVAN